MTSATYPPRQSVRTLIDALDTEVLPAEKAAKRALANPPGGQSSFHQAHYLRMKDAKSWGYCVEEQLDPKAIALGWSTQHQLSKSRPDYYRREGAIDVFVDLTSPLQAVPGGFHITTKLQKAGGPLFGAQWEAADITHRGKLPGTQALAIHTNGAVTDEHSFYFQQYRRHFADDAGYDDAMEAVVRKYGRVTNNRFALKWTKRRRDIFTKTIKTAGSIRKPRRRKR